METLSHSELFKLLRSKQGSTLVGLETRTDARLTDGSKAEKLSRLAGHTGAGYQAGVRREGERQGEPNEFKTQSLPWGKWVIPGKVVEHANKLYLRTQSTPGQRRTVPARVIGYRQDNKRLDLASIRNLISPPSHSRKQGEVGLSPTENQVWVRNYAFDSIEKIRIAGKTFKLVKS